MIILRQKEYSQFSSSMKGALRGAGKGALWGLGLSSPVSLGMLNKGKWRGSLINSGVMTAAGMGVGAKVGWSHGKDAWKSEQLKKEFESRKGELYEKYKVEVSEFQKLMNFYDSVEKFGYFPGYLKKHNPKLSKVWENEMWGYIEHMTLYTNTSLAEFVMALENKKPIKVLDIDIRFDDIQYSLDITYDNGWTTDKGLNLVTYPELKKSIYKFLEGHTENHAFTPEEAWRCNEDYLEDVYGSFDKFKKDFEETLEYERKYFFELERIIKGTL